jgi:tetratricopeptide (TPR) repeat protein
MALSALSGRATAVIASSLERTVMPFGKSPGLLLFSSLTVLLIALPAAADVIYFHDGNILLVDKAWIEGDQVHYQTTSGTRSVPRARVRSIQSEAPPTAAPQRFRLAGVAGARPPSDVTPSTSTDEPAEYRETLSRLRENLRLDPSSERAKYELIVALGSVASLQESQGNLSGALRSMEEARRLAPENIDILLEVAWIHLRQGSYQNAETVLRLGLQLQNNNQDVHYLLGEALYAQEKISEAINLWSAGLLLGPYPAMARSLDQARQEAKVHEGLGGQQSAHFILRYDRAVSDQQLGQQILASLEGHYAQFSTGLVSQPPATIVVILYPDQDYYNVTRSPGWAGGLFDGKIRIPTRGLTRVTPQLTQTLIHELTHAFLASVPQEIPIWFHEGVAQLMEGASSAGQKQRLAQLRRNDQILPFSSMGKSFMNLSDSAAEVAYLQSLSTAEYFVAQFGRPALRNLLDLMSKNYNFENAFRTVTRRTLSEFEIAWQRELLR